MLLKKPASHPEVSSTKFDGTSVKSMDDLKSQLEYYAAGETVDLVVKIADNGSYVEKSTDDHTG